MTTDTASRPQECAIYIAAPRALAPRAQRLAERFREAGFSVVSKWHSHGEPIVDSRATSDRTSALYSNTIDLHTADYIVALMDEGEPRATYCEIGYAVGIDRMIFWVAGTGDSSRACIYDSHPRVTIVPTEDDALELAKARKRSGLELEIYRATGGRRMLANNLRAEVSHRIDELRKSSNGANRETRLDIVSLLTGDAAATLSLHPGQDLSPIAWYSCAMDVLAGSILLAEETLTDDERPQDVRSLN